MAGTLGEGGDEGEVQDDVEGEDDEDKEGEDIVCEPCGEAPIIVAKSPSCPSHEERERHNATHLPYRSWCPVCVQARGKEDSHRKNKKKEDEVLQDFVMLALKVFFHAVDEMLHEQSTSEDSGNNSNG